MVEYIITVELENSISDYSDTVRARNEKEVNEMARELMKELESNGYSILFVRIRKAV